MRGACLTLLILVSCKQPEPVPVQTPPALGQIQALGWGADIAAGDLETMYWVRGDVTTEYAGGTAALVATVVDGDDPSVWYDYNSIGALTWLDIQEAPGWDVNGWPAYSIQSTATIDEYGIHLSIDGIMYQVSYDPESGWLQYNFDGLVTLDLFGDEITIQNDLFYEDYDNFMGEVKIWSRNVVITPPETTEPASPP